MTIAEAIARIDAMKPNQYTEAEKRAWLYSLDAQIKCEITDRYGAGTELPDYGTAASTTELLVPAPFDRVYEYRLAAEIDRGNGELALYNNDTLLFNAALSAFRNCYNAEHTIKGSRFRTV